MANFDRRHVVIQWGGTLPGGEIWSNMVRGGPPSTGDNQTDFPTHEELAAWMSGHIKDALQAWHAHANTMVCNYAKLVWVKVNTVGSDGHYTDATTNEYFYPAPVAGAAIATGAHPQQICLAVSLTTDFDRGPAHRGRFYMPMPTMAVGTDGRLAIAQAQGVADRAKVLIEALADTPGLDTLRPFKILVMSRKAGSPATHPVTGVEVGRVFDTQQRRRNHLAEDYQRAVVDQGVE